MSPTPLARDSLFDRPGGHPDPANDGAENRQPSWAAIRTVAPMTQRFRLRAMPSSITDTLRADGGPVSVVDEYPGYPCRQCLRDAEVGTTVTLVSHDPFTVASPYRSVSPIFLHTVDCGHPDEITEADRLPEQLTIRKLSVRGFDETAMMLDAVTIDGADLRTTIEQLFANPAITELHVHNNPRGCWAATVERR